MTKDRPKVCYKKYLGPDWKPDYDGKCSATIANHQTFGDVFVHAFYQYGSYVMKAEAAKIPTLSNTSNAMMCLLVGNDKQKVLAELQERQKLSEEGKMPELIIHAEGGTTNGYLIKFQKGAFIGERSLRPKSVKYNTYGSVSPGSGILDGIVHHVLIASIPYCTVKVCEMPIFRPNEYFFKTHQGEGEERWETYGRIVREIISEGGDLPIAIRPDGTEVEYRDKLEYKNLLWPKTKKAL